MVLFYLLISLALLIWLIPWLRTFSIPGWLILTVVAGVVFGPAFLSIPGPLSLSSDRILTLVVAGVLAIQWRRGQLKMPDLARHDWVLLALTGWLPAPIVGGLHSGQCLQGI